MAVPDAPGAYWDGAASGCERFWAPVVAPAGLALLDRIGAEVPDWADRERDLLDLGTGTGVLAIEAVRRWNEVRVTGLDPAGEMLRIAGGHDDEHHDGAMMAP